MKFFLTVSFALTLFLTTKMSFAQEQTRQVMGSALESFVELVPYLRDHQALESQAVRESIIKNLESLKETFNKAGHIGALSTPNYSPSLDSLQEHLDETIRAVRAENTSFASKRLQATMSLCISCHAQLPASAAGNFSSGLSDVTRQRFATDFDYAEFLFMKRNYRRGARYYERAIFDSLDQLKRYSSDPAQVDLYQLERQLRLALRKMLTLYTKIEFHPARGVTFFNRVLNHQGLSAMTKRNIEVWIAELQKWQNKKINVRLNSPESVDQFIDQYLTPLSFTERVSRDARNDVLFLTASGILTKYLSHDIDSDISAKALYWLSVVERKLDHQFFFSLSDLYLKECISRFSSSAFARKCFEEYREQIVYGHTGSSGTHIPAQEQAELRRLESLLK